MDPACAKCASRSPVSDGRVIKVELNVQTTLADWTQKHPDGLFGTHVPLATPEGTARCAHMENNGQGAIVPSNAAQGDDAEGFDMGMAIDGASHHDSQGAVFGSESSAIVSGANDVGGTRVNHPAGLLMKAVGQTRLKSSTLTAEHGERKVFDTFPERVNKTWVNPGRADRSPSYRMHASRRHRGDDRMMDRDAVPCLESLQLANEARAYL